MIRRWFMAASLPLWLAAFLLLAAKGVAWAEAGDRSNLDTVPVEQMKAEAASALAEGRPQVAAYILQNLYTALAQVRGDVRLRYETALQLSRILRLSGDFVGAERPLINVIKLPASAAGDIGHMVYTELGSLALARGDLTRAQITLLKAVALARAAPDTDPAASLETELVLATAEIRAFRLKEAAARLDRIDREIATTPGRLARVAVLAEGVRAELFFRQYRYAEALTALQAAYDGALRLYGAAHPEVARAGTSLASGELNIGRYQAAEATLLRSIAVYEDDPAFFAPALATALVNLGQVYYVTGRTALSKVALTRADELAQQSFGGDSQLGAATLLHRGYANLRAGQLGEARADLEQAIAIWTTPETSSQRAAAGTGIWLADVLRRQGDVAAARISLDESSATLEQIFSSGSYPLSDILIGRAKVAIAAGDMGAAIKAAREAATIRIAALGPDHLAALEANAVLTQALAEAGEFVEAEAILLADVARLRVRVAAIHAAQSESALEEIANLRRLVEHYLRAIDLALQNDGAPVGEDLRALSLQLAQLSRSSAAGTAIAGLGQRILASTEAGADGVRRLQEAVLRWQLAARQLTARIIAGEAAGELRADVTEKAAEVLAARDDLLTAQPESARLIIPVPHRFEEIAPLLAAGEAMIAYASLEERTYAWVLTKAEIRLVLLEPDAASLQAHITALRATVDPKVISSLSDIVDYDVAAASALYDMLLAPLAIPDDISHLIIVPDGTLQSLPFAALLTASSAPAAEFAAYRQMPWLINRYEISVLPEIGALSDLRRIARASQGSQPFIGVGDPAFAESITVPEDVAAEPAMDTARLIASLAPLPESRDELNAIADALGAPASSILVGADASEANLAALSLGDYRVIAFATHGLIAGDFGRLREPGLALTPPSNPGGEEDGLLTVGEISRLHLDADWVVLSACNTAAADGSPGAEGLSGLARAFFFAGSRSLLVSQWEVLSVAAVQLTTGLFRAQGDNPGMTRAGALRHAMRAMLNDDQPDYFAHPIFWAPFQLVGEGGVVP
jgi:CHAT domain-containing protein